jgi:hypothetical protein
VYAARYDTKGDGFSFTTSWKFFDTASIHPDARGFEGAFFDGQYVYFVPFAIPNVHTGRMLRYDTKADRSFDDPIAWTHFDTTTVNPYAKGFIGGAFDLKRYAYMAPGPGVFDTGTRPEAVAMQYDTTTAFNEGGTWQTFDTQTIAPTLDGGGPRGFFGTVATNEHVYFVPYGYGGPTRGRVVRYDQAKPFTSASSWELFDTALIDPHHRRRREAGRDARRFSPADRGRADGPIVRRAADVQGGRTARLAAGLRDRQRQRYSGRAQSADRQSP